MSVENMNVRSKIYTYFYGRNTIFQQFLIVFGVLLLLLQPAASVASQESLDKKEDKLRDAYSNARQAYEEIYSQHDWGWGISYGEKVDLTYGTADYDAKKSYNDALEDMEYAEEALNDLRYGDTKPFLTNALKFLGIAAIVVGLIWILYKKLSFNKVGEQDYDKELAFRVEEAKKKGMDKLNIISEQIERVEPVVLNGVARMDNPLVRASGNVFKGVFGRLFLALEVIILGLICAVIAVAIASAVATKGMALFVVVLVLLLAGCGALGYLFYKKFEMDSIVSPRVIEKLRRLNPNLISKLGSDDKVRVSCPSITVYMFGDEQLYMYYQYIDLVTGEIFCEGVHEYFYEDIVGVTSAQEVKKLFKRYGFLKLFLRSVSYLRESISVVTSGCVHSESFIVDVGHSLLDTQFIGMRNLIRQKKAEK